jgi:hypothetical protein
LIEFKDVTEGPKYLDLSTYVLTLVARITEWSGIKVWFGYFVHLLYGKCMFVEKFQILFGEKTYVDGIFFMNK